jgi:uncharacterized membrane protein
MARHPRWVRRVLTPADLDRIAAAVRAAEAGTGAEIRVHLDARCSGDPLARAVAVFERLGLTRTAERSGVLVYLALEDRKLAVIGDTGVHARVPEEYWAGLSALLADHCRAGRAAEGLVAVVAEVGVLLARHFPHSPHDRNELDDEVSLG